MSANIPENLQAFISRYISSVEELEVLLLLRGDKAVCTAEQLSARLRSSSTSIQKRLRGLKSKRLIAEEKAGCFHYAPAKPSVEEKVSALAAFYADHRLTVIEFIFARPVDPIRDFADAFKFQEEEESDG